MKKYRIFKVVGTLGATISIYKACLGEMALIDLIVLALVSVAIFSIGHEMKHRNSCNPVEVAFPLRELRRGVLIKQC